jgi:hypothetical protein
MKSTREQLIFYLKDYYAKHKKSPTIKDINSDARCPSASTFAARFGSWNKALLAADIRINRTLYSKEEMVESLKLLAKELGRTPHSTDLKGRDWIASYSTYKKFFKSWKAALAAAGLAKTSSANLGKFLR